MELSPTQQAALARWHDLGNATPAHPVLQMAYELYLMPMGLRCDSLVYDALEAIKHPQMPLRAVSARFDPTLIDEHWSQYSVIAPILDTKGNIIPIFEENGYIGDFSISSELSDNPNDPVTKNIEAFFATHALSIAELSVKLVTSAKLYIDASLELLIQPTAPSIEYAQMFIDNPRRYSMSTFKAIAQTPA